MAWIMDEYSRAHGYSPSVVTGKPIDLQGSEGREAATGRGVVSVAKQALADMGRPLDGATLAIQGFGNVGSHAALLAHEQGARVVALSDSTGGVARAEGLDVPMLVQEYARPRRALLGYDDDGVKHVSQDEILAADVDILVPAALGGVLTKDNADDVRARVVVEAANAPTTTEADDILTRRGITVIPDILANAGGVTVSYFEWAQNVQVFRWSEERVNHELEDTMTSAYRTVRKLVAERSLTWRTAAYVVALARVARATALRGV